MGSTSREKRYMKSTSEQRFPTSSQLAAELQRENIRVQCRHILSSVFYTILVTASAVVLLVFLLVPVFRIFGNSMSPTLCDGQLVLAVKHTKPCSGDVVALSFGDKIFVKRIIAVSGQWINIKEDGTVYVDSVLLDEPYLTEKDFGSCDIVLPYQVPENRYFVMGDHRSLSMDSRSSSFGCISDELILGRVIFRFWPLAQFGRIF